MRFDSLLNKFLIEYNAQPIEGIIYEQYSIVEKNGFYYLFNEKRNKILGSGKTINQVKELADTINSGC
jgi:hypothetical protein